MSKRAFAEDKMTKKTLEYIQTINLILDEYLQDNYTLTLRQLYYQLVSRDLIANKQNEYKKLSRVCKIGRMNGLIDWNAIEDRLRKLQGVYAVDGVEDALNDTVRSFRLDRMKNQNTFIEVWIEKDAVSSIISRVTRKYGIHLMVNRGYSSASAMYNAAERFKYQKPRDGYILYFGDHDPSGLDMVNDIENRLSEFKAYPKIIPVALTMKQIERYNPPPNPTKLTDSRADKYMRIYGDSSWELDALEPNILATMLNAQILKLINLDTYNAQLKKEEEEKKEIENFAKRYNNE